MASISREDRELMEQLRRKYSTSDAQNQAIGEIIATEASDTGSASMRKDRKKSLDYGLDVVPCSLCQGVGVQQEEYNHRVLERCCTQCDGQGVMMYKDGVLLKEPESTSRDTSRHDTRPVWAQTARERIERLEEQLTNINNKLEEYRKEKDTLCNSTQPCSTEEQRLRDEVVVQLELQVTRLQQLQHHKNKQLEHYKHPTTIDDIIENEGE